MGDRGPLWDQLLVEMRGLRAGHGAKWPPWRDGPMAGARSCRCGGAGRSRPSLSRPGGQRPLLSGQSLLSRSGRTPFPREDGGDRPAGRASFSFQHPPWA